MVGKTISKASNRLFMLGKMRNKISKKIACLVFKQTIAPVLDYCGFLCCGLTEQNQRRIQHVQNRCLRVCLKVKIRYSVIRLHSETEIDFTGVRHDMQLLTLLHKYVHGNVFDPVDFGIVCTPAPMGRVLTRSVRLGTIVLRENGRSQL